MFLQAYTDLHVFNQKNNKSCDNCLFSTVLKCPSALSDKTHLCVSVLRFSVLFYWSLCSLWSLLLSMTLKQCQTVLIMVSLKYILICRTSPSTSFFLLVLSILVSQLSYRFSNWFKKRKGREGRWEEGWAGRNQATVCDHIESINQFGENLHLYSIGFSNPMPPYLFGVL